MQLFHLLSLQISNFSMIEAWRVATLHRSLLLLRPTYQFYVPTVYALPESHQVWALCAADPLSTILFVADYGLLVQLDPPMPNSFGRFLSFLFCGIVIYSAPKEFKAVKVILSVSM